MATRTALLDTSVLLALFDPAHIHHEVAHDWFAMEREGGWATCPITENGCVRLLSDPGYSKKYETPSPTAFQVLNSLRQFRASGHHVFWPDDVSLGELSLDTTRHFGFRQITDIYLLALAVKNGGRLVTFDKSIPLPLLKGAARDHLEVLSLA
jgi:toxin-antitoxin system PIN domain toxin